MSERPSGGGGGSRLSPQTLVVASLASLTAAIVTSTFWQKGTPITAAITPVLVALASELYSRPARRLSEFGSRASTRTRSPEPRAPERERVAMGAPPRRSPARPPITEPTAAGPIRIYRSEGAQRRRVSLRLAIATAAVAFLIAMVVLTVPELVFGGSVASSGNTTFFGGGSHHKSTQPQQKPATTPQTTNNQSTPTAPQQTTTQPPAQTAPQTTTPGATPPAGAPQTTTPAQTAPAP